MPIATRYLVEKGTPTNLDTLLLRIDELEKRLVRLEAENTLLRTELTRKDKIIADLQQRLFGPSSEKLDPAQLQLLFDEILLGKPEPLPETSDETSAPSYAEATADMLEDEKPSVPKNRRTKAERFPKNLMILIEKEIIPDEVLTDPDTWQQIGEEHHDELDVTNAQIFWRRTVCKKFVHKTEKARPPVIAPAPLPSIPGTLLAPALAAQIIADKYQDHLSHYRKSQRFRRRHDIDIRRQTLNTWTPATARHLIPIGQAIREEILQAKELQIDETPIDYLVPGHGSTRGGHLWAYRDIAKGTCYFDWHPGRGAECLLDFLGYDQATNTITYQGGIHTDGYSVYDSVAAKHGLRQRRLPLGSIIHPAA